MNNPFSFPGAWLHTWTGLTYKISQASWNPDNLGQSTVQILRDPGWLLKWIGSLFVVTGVFLMFYVRGFRRGTAVAPVIAPAPLKSQKHVRAPEEAIASEGRPDRAPIIFPAPKARGPVWRQCARRL